MLKIVNAFIKDHRQELGLKGYSKMSYLEKLKYLEGKVKGTKYEREIGKLTKPRVDEGIKKVLDKSGRGKNVRVKKEKKPVDKKLNQEMKSLHSKTKFTKLEEAKPSQTAVAKPKLKPKPKGKVKKAVAKIEEEIDKSKPKPKKTTTKEALQEMPLDIGGKISELQKKGGETHTFKLDKQKITFSPLKKGNVRDGAGGKRPVVYRILSGMPDEKFRASGGKMEKYSDFNVMISGLYGDTPIDPLQKLKQSEYNFGGTISALDRFITSKNVLKQLI